ncbi:MAG: primase-like DNA-binding domain-containing protein, partial [Desulfobacterales bacterium]|nr:primase-like DNA-binding domain-containing protein [Desulfobacterales bacterium]
LRQFERTPENANLRKNLLENRTEMSKVFSLLVVIAKKLNDKGKFTDITSTKVLREEWNKHSDPIMQFINECIVEVVGKTVTKSETYAAYKEFCYRLEIQPLTIRRFGVIFGEYYEGDQGKQSGINRKIWLDIQIKIPEKQSKLKEFQD